MGEMKFDGTIRAVRKTENRKKNADMRTAGLTVMSEEGDKAVLTFGDPRAVLGFNPEDRVVVSVRNANKTLSEAIKPAPEKDGAVPEKPVKKR